MSKKSKSSSLAASAKAIDPTLDALFASSSGPVELPPKARYTPLIEKKPKPPPQAKVVLAEDNEVDEEQDDEVLSELSGSFDEDDIELEGSEASASTGEASEEDSNGAALDEDLQDADPATVGSADSPTRKERKRKRKDDFDDLESKYLSEAAPKDDQPDGKRHKHEKNNDGPSVTDEDDAADAGDVPMHESLAADSKAVEVEKASRTVFLANVSSEAISSKTAKKNLLTHLSTHLDVEGSAKEKIESIRFRSVAYSTVAMPKRGAFATKALMESTTKAVNAYVVYPTAAAARKACSELNGTEVLGRHIRVDSVAHPSPTDHRRCVFVGNLGFVDDETVVKTNADGETEEKKRNKVPSDVEEGLWRTFGKQGKVENVRVVRDPKTRVGKGFAYVQFYNGNDVESALLLDGKKFPPMLPRALRVTRAKDPRKTASAQERVKAKMLSSMSNSSGNAKNNRYRPKATPDEQSMAGRAGKLLGRAGAHQRQHRGGGRRPESKDAASSAVAKTPEQVVFEGKRASARDGKPKDLRFGKKKQKKAGGREGGGGKSGKAKPTTRSARRGAEWKKQKS